MRTYLTLVVLTSVAFACSADGTSSSSSGDAPADAAVVTERDGGPLPSGDAGTDAATIPQDFVLTLDGKDIPIDQATRTIETSEKDGYRTTNLKARIIDSENLPWNTTKVPLDVRLESVQATSIPMPLGDIECVRNPTEPYQFSTVIIGGPGAVVTYRSTDASCVANIETWNDGVAYKGSAKGFLRGDAVLKFTFAWNVSKK